MTASAKSIALAMLAALGSSAAAAERPNIVWILSEDNSKHYLRLFDEGGARAPAIERLAAEGLTFDRAFSCSPVCSVARTTLMTGVYAPRAGTQFHRKIKPAHLPDGWSLFPAKLKQCGYYVTNNAKEDYNAAVGDDVWHESSRRATWRNRPNTETPFFHMHSFTQSHESSLHFAKEEIDLDKISTPLDEVPLAPYHPDTRLFRYTHAYYLERMRVIDEKVEDLVADLESDGLLEDTFIFYFGDHGGVLPRSKGYLYETGLHIPLVVRIPENWKRLVDRERGERVHGFVEFVDFGPTTLKLAGVDLPDSLDGKPFIGPGVSRSEVDGRDETFGYSDRFDEKYDLVRSLRKGDIKYVRHFFPYYPDSLQNNYRYNMLAYREWRELYLADSLNETQRRFFERRAAEELYDIASDPHETNNLAADPKYSQQLLQMRKRLADRMKQTPDLSLFPESVLVKQAMDDPVAYGKQHADRLARYLDVVNLCLLPRGDAISSLKGALESQDPLERHWAEVACASLEDGAEELEPMLTALLGDEEPLVRIRAAECLAGRNPKVVRETLEELLRTERSPTVALIALNATVYLRDGPAGIAFDIKPNGVRADSDGVRRRLQYLNSPLPASK